MKAILVDTTKCTGCMACVHACVKNSGGDAATATPGDSGLDAGQLSTVIRIGDGYAKKSCMHCLEPNCAAACLVGAIEKTDAGPVIYDADKCIGCRYCMLACPFHIPRYEWQSLNPAMKKCDMCYDKVKDGKAPRCVAACTHKVLEFGDREALLQKAHDRIATRSDKYRDHVWGEKEWGGTSVVYIADRELMALGWPDADTSEPISKRTDPLIHATPAIGIGVLLGTWGLSAIIQRRNKLMNKETTEANEGSSDTEEERNDAE